MMHSKQFTTLFLIGLVIAALVGCGNEPAKPAADSKTKPPATTDKPGQAATETPPTADNAQPAAPQEANISAKDEAAGRKVLQRMLDAYRKASSYGDAGTVRMFAEADGRTLREKTADFSLTLVRPNKLRMQAYGAKVVCDGKRLFASLDDVPGQVLSREAPARLTLPAVLSDWSLTVAVAQGFAGAMPQLMLLLGDAPLDDLLRDVRATAIGRAGPNRRPRLRSRESGRAGRHGHVLDRSGNVGSAARCHADRQSAPRIEPGRSGR